MAPLLRGILNPGYLVPPHRNNHFIFQHHVVASNVIVWIVHGLLEHGAVYYSCSTGIEAPEDAHRVTSIVTVTVAHIGTTVANHYTRRQ